MKNFKIKKTVDVGKLHKELVDAGFDIDGVSYDGKDCYVHLKDTETKDPTAIIKAHKFVKPLEDKELFKQLATDKEKIDFIAKRVGLV